MADLNFSGSDSPARYSLNDKHPSQNLPARKSAMASWICACVFITNGP
jgi:hypothetical protein